jgi:hypothetical protein
VTVEIKTDKPSSLFLKDQEELRILDMLLLQMCIPSGHKQMMLALGVQVRLK